ncbi:50S ribosomal protein L13 [Sulfodiicoccus acidiphilus]|nr:50S ribosomal protein L13 [Sulfodiicoccus acidiphilus]
MEELVLDGEGQILGRMATMIVKQLKQGKTIIVVNAEKVVISGELSRVLAGYRLLMGVRTMFNPSRQGIRRPRNPISLVKRTVRGMLPDNPSGNVMYRKLKVYVGVPEQYVERKKVKFPEAHVDRLKGKYVTVGELTRELGWKSEL